MAGHAGAGDGLRRGEILALRWRNVDLTAGAIRVVESLEQTKAGLRFKSTKSEKGRGVALPSFATAELRRDKQAQAETLLALGVRQSGDTLVCGRVDGQPKQPARLTHEFTYLVGRINSFPTTFGIAMRRDCSPVVSIPRSYRSALVIRQSLLRVTPGMQSEAVAKLDLAFGDHFGDQRPKSS